MPSSETLFAGHCLKLNFKQFRFALLAIFALGGGVLLTLLLFPQDAFAANRYWVGSAGGNTNDTANWASADPASCTGGGASVPGSADIAIFDADCDNSATIDANLNVLGINLNSGYAGTVTQASSSAITVGTSDYIQAGGTFSGDEATIDLNDAFTLSGGTFTAASGTMTVAGSFTVSGTPTFTHNGGTVTFDGGSATLACNNVTFNAVNITNTTAGTKTINSDCSLPLGANPTFGGGNGIALSGGTLSGSGALTINGVLIINSGGTLSGFSGTLTTTGLTFNSGTTEANLGAGITGIIVNGLGDFTVSGANVNLGNFTTVDLNDAFSLSSSGSFTAPSGTMTVAESFTISSGTTFDANGGTVTFDGGSATLACNNVTFNAVNITNTTAGTKTINSDCSLPLGANPTVGSGNGITLNGTFSGSGTITMTGTVTMNSGSVFSGFSTVAFTGSGTLTITCGSGSNTLNNVAVIVNSTGTRTQSGNCTVGAFTLTAGTWGNPSAAATLSVTGNFAQNAATTFGGANLTVEFSSSSAQDISKTAGTFSSILTVNKTGSNAAKLTAALAASGQTCTVVEGTFDLNGQVFTCGSTFTIEDGGTLQLQGGESPTAPTLNSGSTVKYTGDGDSAVDNYTIKDYAYHHLTIASTDSGDTFATPNTTEDANGNFTVSSGTFTAPSGNFTIAGNFAHSAGTFTHNSGSIVLDGTDQQITGATTFNNLTKSVTTARTLTFASSTTQTIAGTTTLKGQSGSLLTLVSSSPGTQWSFDPQGTRDIEFVDVADSNNINSSVLNCVGFNCTDSGNNTNWTFVLAGGRNSPSISSIEGKNITAISATVVWHTSVSVETKLTGQPVPVASSQDAERKTWHEASFINLSPDTIYFYTIHARRPGTSDESTVSFSFRTLQTSKSVDAGQSSALDSTFMVLLRLLLSQITVVVSMVQQGISAGTIESAQGQLILSQLIAILQTAARALE